MEKGKVRLYEYCGIVLMMLLIMGIFLQPLYAAESQYGIWCPVCKKWQDLYHGVVDSGTLTRTEFNDGKVTYNDSGTVYIKCSDCKSKLLKFEWSEISKIINAGTSNERQIWDKHYSVNKCEKDVVFPFLEISLTENEDSSESYQIFCEGNVFTANSDGSATKDKAEDAMNCYKRLFDAMAKSLTVRQESNNEATIREICSITSGFFTWEQWYDYGYTTSTSGSISSGLIDYLARFGKEAVRERQYQITFYANGGEGSLLVVSVKPGSNSLPKNSYMRKGYLFLGWASSAGGAVQYMDGENIEVSSDLDLYAVWKKEPPGLSVFGDVQVKLYRDGSLFDGTVDVGDRVEIIPNKQQGREYADFSISGGQASWDDSAGILSFIMPDVDVSVEVFVRELRGLEVSLNALFFETYQKAPYWDGTSFSVDSIPPIIIEKNMLKVEAIFYNTRIGRTEKREVQDFTIVSGDVIESIGENIIVVEADALLDGYLLSAQCMVQAASPDLNDLMNQTESATYTELKRFVERLTARLAECESLVEELSEKLVDSEKEKEDYEKLISDARAEIDRLTGELDKAMKEIDKLSGELAGSKVELGNMEKELSGMKEKLDIVQKLMQELTGTEEFDPALLDTLREKFDDLKKEKDELADSLAKLETEKKDLFDKVSQLENEKNGLESEKTDLTDKVAGLENERLDLTDKVTGLENEKTDLGDRLSDLENENEDLISRYDALYAAHKELLKERDSLLQAKQALKLQNNNLEAERESLVAQNRRLLADNEILIKSNEDLSDQLKHTIEEQQNIFREYELVKKKFEQQPEVPKELEIENLAGMEQKLQEMEREKKELSDQIAEMEQEKLKLDAKWQKEKTELSASIRKLEQEIAEKEMVQKTERETVSKEPFEQESAEMEKESAENESVEKDIMEWMEESEALEEPDGNEEESGTKLSEENMEVGEELQDMTEMEEETESIMETEQETESIEETESVTEEGTSEWSFPVKDKDKGSFGGGKKVLPGIFIVLAAMLLGGIVLYVAMDQKEKEADYSG